MKKLIKIIGIIVGIIVLVTLIMAIFSICPPKGPWPTPPWCEGGTQLPKIKMQALPSILRTAEKINIADTIIVPTREGGNDFGCFPPSCSMILDATARRFCEDWKEGKQVMWSADCGSLPIEGCRKLCEHEKTIFVAEKINIADTIVVPTDVSKIDYPIFYEKPAAANVTIENPYCAIAKETVAYPVRYLGNHELPRIDGAPLPAGITRIGGIKDTWIPEPNKNRGCGSVG